MAGYVAPGGRPIQILDGSRFTLAYRRGAPPAVVAIAPRATHYGGGISSQPAVVLATASPSLSGMGDPLKAAGDSWNRNFAAVESGERGLQVQMPFMTMIGAIGGGALGAWMGKSPGLGALVGAAAGFFMTGLARAARGANE